MKTLLFTLSLAIALPPPQAPAEDATGIWTVEFVGPIGDRPRTVGGMLLELAASGSKLTGIAHMNNWPDCAYISEGSVVGNRVTFTANGKSPWNSDSLTGYPRLRFTGTIRGDQITLVVNWGSVVSGGLGNKPVKDLEQPGNDLPMEGRRLR